MIRVALIGYGYAGRTFHAPLLRATPGLELAVVCSSRPERVRTDLPDVAIVPSPEQVCVASSVELVVIATPNDTHAPIAAMALRAGKHVVVDKPFTVTLDEARQLTTLARSSGCVLSVFHSRRWDGDFLAIRDLLASGVLGAISHFESHFDRFRPVVRDRWRERSGPGSGLWYDLGPHLVDQTLQLFGLPERVIASFAAQRTAAQSDDWAHVVLEYPRLRAVLHASVLVAAPTPRFIVHGQTASWIKVGVDAQERQLVAALTPGDARSPGPREHAELIEGANGAKRETPIPRGDYRQFYLRLVDAIRGDGANPVAPEQALRVVAVVETALRAAAEGRALPPPLSDGEVEIRAERPDDIGAIREVNRRAFGQDQEGNIVDALRSSGASRLSLVATVAGRVVGHVIYSPASIAGVTGAALGPMSVAPDYQRQGIGSRLVEAGNRMLRATACPFIVVLGHARFYPRFGFVPASTRGITCEWSVPDDVFMVAVLDERKMEGVSGLTKYREEFSAVS
jgi:predicted dehydrogenase/predicted N-acetyltransferase YhbS